MKLTSCLVACVLLLMGATVWAQSDSDYQAWMKSTGMNAGALNKALMAKTGDPAVMAAKTLQENMGKVEAYWKAKDVPDAEKFAMDAQVGFGKVADLAAAGNFEEAAATMKMTQANCAGCHMAHREKLPDGSFKMK